MATDNVALHHHHYVISVDTFNKCPAMVENMLITQTDFGFRTNTRTNVTFVNSYEAKNYHIYTTMYHPEYLSAPNNEFRKIIGKKLCEKFTQTALMNDNKPDGELDAFMEKWAASKGKFGQIFGGGMDAWGYENSYKGKI